MRNATDIHPKVAAGLASAVATIAALGAAGVDLTPIAFTLAGLDFTFGMLTGVGGFLLGAYGWPEQSARELESDDPADFDESGENDSPA